jgi:hypothetical protein
MEMESIDLRWQVQAEQERLIQSLAQVPVREQDAVARIETLLALEAAVKLKHFTALVRVKNALTESQVAQLDALQRCGADGEPLRFERFKAAPPPAGGAARARGAPPPRKPPPA